MFDYRVTYENLDNEPDLPQQQDVTDPTDLSTAFSVVAQEAADAWLSNPSGYEVDGFYTVTPAFGDLD